MKYLLIAIYSTTIITAEPQTNYRKCLIAAKEKIGQLYNAIYYATPDNPDENNIITLAKPPKVVMAFCVKGSAAE